MHCTNRVDDRVAKLQPTRSSLDFLGCLPARQNPDLAPGRHKIFIHNLLLHNRLRKSLVE